MFLALVSKSLFLLSQQPLVLPIPWNTWVRAGAIPASRTPQTVSAAKLIQIRPNVLRSVAQLTTVTPAPLPPAQALQCVQLLAAVLTARLISNGI